MPAGPAVAAAGPFGDTPAMSTTLPDLAEVLGRVLQRVPREQQPLLVALAERLAAERYRGWAREDPEHAAGLLECAAREEEIARRVEALHPTHESTTRELMARNPDLLEINRSLFVALSLAEQLALQARGERLGAATWRAFARADSDPERRDAFLACALLEEESAAFLESVAKR